VGLSVASVTVAYKGAEVLPRQIEALLAQSRPLQEIVVVDNASSDGTSTLLAKRYPQVTVLRLTENVGVGGGLAAGLAYAALEKKHEWVWTFDQDSVPHRDSLEMLLTGVALVGNQDGEVGIAAALPVHERGSFLYRPWLWRDGLVKPSPEALQEPVWFADLVITAGCMISRVVVERVGLPRADFFMDFVDFEYCLRARRQGYKVVVVPRARVAHEIGNGREVRLPGFRRLWYNQAPFREYYYSRNLAYFVWWLYPSNAAKRFVLRHLVRRAMGLLVFGSNKLACLKKIGQGFRDGRRAHLGIRFRPTDA
jgi:GT2 family glycosyltransferase